MEVYVVCEGGMRNLATGVLVEDAAPEGLFPADALYPSDTLYPAGA